MSTELTLYRVARTELQEILDAGAKALKPAGLEMMPIKRAMLRLPDTDADLILDALNLLFAACLTYENAQWQIDRANNPVDLVASRIEAGKAEGVVNALFHGPTAQLLITAMDRSPIAFYALSQTAPDLLIIDRCKHVLGGSKFKS